MTNYLRRFASDDVRAGQWFSICRQIGVVLSSIVLARMMPQRDVGNVEMLYLCGYLLTFFWSEALMKGYLAWKNQHAVASSNSTFLLLLFILGIASMLVLWAGQSLWIPLFTGQSSVPGLGLFVWYQALILPVWMAPFIGLVKGQRVLLTGVYVLFGPALAVYFGYKQIDTVHGVMIGLVSYALVGFGWILTQVKFFSGLVWFGLLKNLWPLTWPLILYALTVAVARSFDAWLVVRHFDESQFAVFRYGAREFPVVIALAAGLSASMIPRMLQVGAVEELRQRSMKLMHWCYPMIMMLILVSPPVFALVFGSVYRESAFIFNVYLLVCLTQLVFPQTYLTAQGDNRIQFVFAVIELVINVVLSLVFLSLFGMIGVVWATVIAFAVEKALLFHRVKQRYQVSPVQFVSLWSWIGYGVLMLLCVGISSWWHGQ